MKQVRYRNYVKEVAKEFPDVDEDAIARVALHGMKMLGSFIRKGHDIFLNHNINGYYFYFGKIVKGAYNRIVDGAPKLRKKYRALYRLQKVPYSGEYYYGLNEANYAKHLKGEPIEMVVMFKIMEEALLYREAKHFFRCKMEDDNWCLKKENYETNNSEYIQPGNEDGFKSINNP